MLFQDWNVFQIFFIAEVDIHFVLFVLLHRSPIQIVS